MTRLLRAALVMAVLFSCSPLRAQEDEDNFLPGETLHYKILQMGIKAGDAVLKFIGPAVIHDVDTMLIEFTADGFNFYDQEKIYVDPTTFKPLAVMRDLNIFGRREKIQETYFPDDNKIVIQKTSGNKTTQQVLNKKGEIDNIYGFLYRARKNALMRPGERFEVSLPTKDLTMKVLKKLKLMSAGKKVDAFYLESSPPQYKIWFAATPQRLPLRISGAIGLANTVMVLTQGREEHGKP